MLHLILVGLLMESEGPRLCRNNEGAIPDYLQFDTSETLPAALCPQLGLYN